MFEATQNSREKKDLINGGTSFLIDLTREKERILREKKNEQDLTKVKVEVTERLKELEKIRQELSKEVKKKTEGNDNILFLVKLYETMSADKVASLLKQMPFNISIEMIRRMKPKISSQVLAAMDERLASEIGRKLIQSPLPATDNNP